MKRTVIGTSEAAVAKKPNCPTLQILRRPSFTHATVYDLRIPRLLCGRIHVPRDLFAVDLELHMLGSWAL